MLCSESRVLCTLVLVFFLWLVVYIDTFFNKSREMATMRGKSSTIPTPLEENFTILELTSPTPRTPDDLDRQPDVLGPFSGFVGDSETGNLSTTPTPLEENVTIFEFTSPTPTTSGDLDRQPDVSGSLSGFVEDSETFEDADVTDYDPEGKHRVRRALRHAKKIRKNVRINLRGENTTISQLKLALDLPKKFNGQIFAKKDITYTETKFDCHAHFRRVTKNANVHYTTYYHQVFNFTKEAKTDLQLVYLTVRIPRNAVDKSKYCCIKVDVAKLYSDRCHGRFRRSVTDDISELFSETFGDSGDLMERFLRKLGIETSNAEKNIEENLEVDNEEEISYEDEEKTNLVSPPRDDEYNSKIFAFTTAPTTLTNTPTVSTNIPTGFANGSAASDAPTESTNAPTVSTNAPTVSTNAPTVSTNAPTVSAKAPTVSINAPTSSMDGLISELGEYLLEESGIENIQYERVLESQKLIYATVVSDFQLMNVTVQELHYGHPADTRYVINTKLFKKTSIGWELHNSSYRFMDESDSSVYFLDAKVFIKIDVLIDESYEILLVAVCIMIMAVIFLIIVFFYKNSI